MKFYSTRNKEQKVSFKEAVINGLAPDGGLYMPEHIPVLPNSFFETIENKSEEEIAFQVLQSFVNESIPDTILQTIVAEALSFDLPVIQIQDNIYVLELFHGPTQAFKDVGARFMSRCLGYFNKDSQDQVTVLVATSGDTGSAVAHGFYEVNGVGVKVLFPKGKVSAYQEFQMTSLGKNITAIEIDGTFDDCQALVKEAFNDEDLRSKIQISSANSINLARLLPQMVYYFIAYKQVKSILKSRKLVFAIPSGNLGNATAALLAKKMGLPIDTIIAAHNENNAFEEYLETGNYNPKKSVQTYSNAMDVGAPSNIERLHAIYNHDLKAIKSDFLAMSYNDLETLNIMDCVYKETGYVTDPHGALGFQALIDSNIENSLGIFLETAHPLKFIDIVHKVIPDYKGIKVDLAACHKIEMQPDYAKLRSILLND